MTGAHSNWSPLRENQWNDQIWSQQIGGGETIGEGDQKFRGSAKDALCPFPLITIAKETMKWSNRISKNRGEKNDFFFGSNNFKTVPFKKRTKFVVLRCEEIDTL